MAKAGSDGCWLAVRFLSWGTPGYGAESGDADAVRKWLYISKSGREIIASRLSVVKCSLRSPLSLDSMPAASHRRQHVHSDEGPGRPDTIGSP